MTLRKNVLVARLNEHWNESDFGFKIRVLIALIGFENHIEINIFLIKESTNLIVDY